MKCFETKLKQDALKNSKEWLNKSKTSPEVVDALFTPMLKYPKDKNTGEFDYTRAPSLNVKLGYWNDEFDCEVYDHDQKQLFPANDATKTNLMALIPKSANVAVILKCGGLWFANGKFGCTWKLVQAAVKPKVSFKGKCLISLSSDEVEKLKEGDDSEPASSSSTTDTESSSVELVNDSDDEEEEVKQEVVAEVAKVVEEEKKTVATKKVVRRKVAGDV